MRRAIKLARAGLREPEKPIGCYLFSGPTGVGKTEVAKQLADLMGVELLRFDMSEYMEKHTVSRLIGAPPGYVGFDQGGLLTDGVDQHPHCVLLLDEIEKAHPDLFNILLQVMDHGKLTDHNGKSVDFRNVILIMTTNAGASDMAKPAMGFDRAKREGEDTEAINRMFTPEFRNRLDAVDAVRRPAAGGHRQGGREVRLPARGAACRPRRARSSCRRRRRSGWPRRATTRSSAPGRSAASSRSTSRSRSPRSCCSASSSTAARSRCSSPARARSARSRFEYLPADPTKRPKAKSEDDEDDGRAAAGARRRGPAEGAAGARRRRRSDSRRRRARCRRAAPQERLTASTGLRELKGAGSQGRRFRCQAISSGVLPTRSVSATCLARKSATSAREIMPARQDAGSISTL